MPLDLVVLSLGVVVYSVFEVLDFVIEARNWIQVNSPGGLDMMRYAHWVQG